jgi:hypothetical protein
MFFRLLTDASRSAGVSPNSAILCPVVYYCPPSGDPGASGRAIACCLESAVIEQPIRCSWSVRSPERQRHVRHAGRAARWVLGVPAPRAARFEPTAFAACSTSAAEIVTATLTETTTP